LVYAAMIASACFRVMLERREDDANFVSPEWTTRYRRPLLSRLVSVLLVLSIVVVGLSFRSSKSRSIRITSVVAATAVISAAAGGVLFVLSDFQNSPNSAQMGGSFIVAYAFYFIELYLTKS
jgi:hypothetical protein